MNWTALADESTDTFISLFGQAVAGAGVVVVVVIGFAMAVVAVASRSWRYSSWVCVRSAHTHT